MVPSHGKTSFRLDKDACPFTSCFLASIIRRDSGSLASTLSHGCRLTKWSSLHEQSSQFSVPPRNVHDLQEINAKVRPQRVDIRFKGYTRRRHHLSKVCGYALVGGPKLHVARVKTSPFQGRLNITRGLGTGGCTPVHQCLHNGFRRPAMRYLSRLHLGGLY